MKRWMDLRALRRLTRHLDPDGEQVLVAGVEHGNGVWAAYRTLEEVGGRPRVVWGISPKPVDEWSKSELEAWLAAHP